MEYEIITTNVFDDWFAGIKDIRSKARIITRFDRVRMGNELGRLEKYWRWAV